MKRRAMTLLILILASCERTPSKLLQGYVEGEFVHVSAPSGGKLKKVHVQRGRQAKAGDPLFALEAVTEMAARDEAAQRLEQAKATLEDAKKGRRATEIDSLKFQLMQAQEDASFSALDLARQETLRKTGAVAIESIDHARTTHEQSRLRVKQLEAELKTAELGMRNDAVAALEAEVKARESALVRAEWDLSQRQQSAPQAGLVDDTLYREGEFVVAGRPVISLLPPANMKVRAFVPQTRLSTLHPGDAVKVYIDGFAEAISARVSFIAPQAEYTPPVIYSQENRSKLVFMIELRFDDTVAAKLHPGQPVDVEFAP